MADEKLREVLEEEELIKRIADLPDIESMRRVIQTIEDKEKRERIIDRVATILEERERQKLRPIDREAIVEAISYERASYAGAGIAMIAGLVSMASGSVGGFILGLIFIAVGAVAIWVGKRYRQYIENGS